MKRIMALLCIYMLACSSCHFSADTYNHRGIEKYRAAKYQDAIAEYDKALALKPDYADALYNRVVAYDKLNQHQNKPLKII